MTEFQAQSVDPGLFSLAQIMHLLRVEFSRAQRYEYPLICMILAVDRLASLRDLYGYDSKEGILQEVVRLLQEETRACDFAGRLADDRLMLLVPHTSPKGARGMAQRLLDRVRQLRFQGEGKSLTVTVSIGAAAFRKGSMFFDSLLTDAQEALEEALSSGGDRCVVRHPEEDAD